MKIKCEDHSRRVYVLGHGVVHRDDGTVCGSSHLRLGRYVCTPGDVRVGDGRG